MLKIEMVGAREMLAGLEKFRKSAVPYAARDTVNSLAFEGRRIWGDEIRRTMVTRNRFTAGPALQVDKARGTSLETMQAELGSIAEYMPRQEFGATVTGRAGHKGIPGPVAAGQAAGGRRTKPVRVGNRMSAIHAVRAAKGASRHQRNAIAMAIAKRTGRKYVVLERPGGGTGVFVLGGGKRKLTAKLVWDVSRRSVRIEPHPTLGPTLRRLEALAPRIQEQALMRQLQRHKILGY